MWYLFYFIGVYWMSDLISETTHLCYDTFFFTSAAPVCDSAAGVDECKGVNVSCVVADKGHKFLNVP